MTKTRVIATFFASSQILRMLILFLHGWHSVPGGVKPSYLKENGHEVLNPHLDDNDFQAALQTAQSAYDSFRPDVVVGSSRGGAVALNIDSKTTPLVLLCPAWKKWGTIKTLKPNAMILHSRKDDVIPFGDSQELVTTSGLPLETLVEVGDDHRLADEASLSVMLWACQILTSGELLPVIEDERRATESFRRRHGAESYVESSQDGSYLCDACGEEIVIPLDLSEGTNQRYVEDCPVCCRANVIHVEVDHEGHGHVWAEPEQDYD